jgi:hypothetical protein
MSIAIIAGFLFALQSAPAPQAATCQPMADQTGIEWTFPFERALERAKRENRILMVKPIAFGTTRDGNW